MRANTLQGSELSYGLWWLPPPSQHYMVPPLPQPPGMGSGAKQWGRDFCFPSCDLGRVSTKGMPPSGNSHASDELKLRCPLPRPAALGPQATEPAGSQGDVDPSHQREFELILHVGGRVDDVWTPEMSLWCLMVLIGKNGAGSSPRGSAETNPTRIHEDADSIPSLAQWAQDPALP